ncbi:MAG: S4 domain-containing protein [Butyricicoccus sp.]
MEERLQKLLAQAGLCSRREAERWIDDGRVTVNGKKASVGDKADPRRDKIFVDGKPIGGAEEKVYLMLYKPRGYVTTMKDEHGRKTVADLVRLRCACRAGRPSDYNLRAAADQRQRSAQRADPSAPRGGKAL